MRSLTSSIVLLAILLVASLQTAVAVESPAELGSTATDGKSYATKFAVSIVRPDSAAQVAIINQNEAVNITGSINPDPAHVNKNADIFVVILDVKSATYYMRNLVGQFVKWNGVVSQLQPAQENVLLTSNYQVPIYTGIFANPGNQMVFLGYMSKVSPALIYTPLPGMLEIKALTINVAPLTYFSDYIESDILPRCLACHYSGGLAKDSMLILERSSSTSLASNFSSFDTLAKAKGIGYILTKVTGGNNHGGAAQLNLGSSDYNNLATFLQLQQGNTEVITASGNQFFEGVTLQTRAETLRRAAIMLAGRGPTQTEIDLVSKGDEAVLRTTLRGLMAGEGFHKFLTEGANDRLLVRGVQGPVIDTNFPFYPKYTTEIYNLRVQALNAGKSPVDITRAEGPLKGPGEEGLRRSVEELVAYIAENDRPYTEVVTADYMMMSPVLNFVFEGGATFKNLNNRNEFQPGKLYNSFLLKPGEWHMQNDRILGFYFTAQPTIRHPWEHAGILNNPAFLARYPSTATNRNRARARWTLLHFADIDIEKSTQRPTDPAALADRNNPTMNNAACTACHERMDPVAAAFQNYSDSGFYRYNYTDSLDFLYKYPPNNGPTLYQNGDTWYRDMRTPGLLGQSISSSSEPLKQLASLLIKDKGFATAAVKFWWPSVMNADVLIAPAVTTDSDYASKFAAYQAQVTAIEQFATNFRKDYNLRNLLVDMMMSPWFRAKATTNSSQRAALAIAEVGIEKLLTPERLQRKAAALTGFNWGANASISDPFTVNTNLGTGNSSYNGIYGGIDSATVVTRARDITPLMSTVAQTFALESSCPIVVKEFGLPDGLRKLFGGITPNVTSQWQGTSTAEVLSTSQTDWKALELSVELGKGNNQLIVTLDNPYCDFDQATQKCRTQRSLYLDRFEIKSPGQNSYQPFEITQTMVNNFPPSCFKNGASDAVTYGQCGIPIDFSTQTPGTYQIRAIVAGVQAGVGNIVASLTIRETGDPLLSTAIGAKLIRQKLVELHYKLLGKTYALEAPEITAAYKLFVDTLQEKTALKVGTTLNSSTKTCAWYGDMNFMDGLPFAGNPRIPNKNGGDFYDWEPAASNFVSTLMTDPNYVKQSWLVVVAYLLGHYNFLYE